MQVKSTKDWLDHYFTTAEKVLFSLLRPFRNYVLLNFFQQHYLNFLLQNNGLDETIVAGFPSFMEKAHQLNFVDLSEDNGWYLMKLCPDQSVFCDNFLPKELNPTIIDQAFLNYAHEAARGALYYFLRAEEEAVASKEGVELMNYEEFNLSKALFLQIAEKQSVAYCFSALDSFYRYNQQFFERLMFSIGVLTEMLAHNYANANDDAWLDYIGVQNAFADACMHLNMLEAAEKMLRAAIETAESAAEDSRIKNYLGYTSHNLGMALIRQRRFEESIPFLRMTLDLLQDTNDAEIKALTALNLGVAKLEENELDEAKKLFEEAYSLFENAELYSETAFALQNLGMVEEKRKEKPAAKNYYQEALKLFQEFGNEQSAAQILVNLGSLTGDLGEFDESMQFFKEALSIFLKLEDEYYQALCFRNMGLIYLQRKQQLEATEMFFKSLRLQVRFQSGHDLKRIFKNIKQLAEEGNDPALIQNALQILVDVFEVSFVEQITGFVIKVE